jgi:hypothetical protein
MTSFEDEYFDVLQNIEFAIIQVYHRDQSLVDYDVEKAINALIQTYKRPNQRQAPKLGPNSLAEEVYEAVKVMCDWRLGAEMRRSPGDYNPPPDIEPLSVDEIIACLKRIRRSVQNWTKRSVRRGYLEFIDQYIV